MNRLEELQHLNRTARALAELIARNPEYEGLYNDIRIMIDSNEEQIFQLMKRGEHEKTSLLLSAR